MPERVRVKICGITTAEDARAAAEAGADAIGLNFVDGSPRRVTPETARGIVAALPAHVCTVGVFVNQPRRQVEAIAVAVGLRALQFHGAEGPQDCAGWDRKVLKALRVGDRQAAVRAREFHVDFILVDAYVEGAFGGTGRRIEVSLLAEFDPHRLVVAGGLTAENVAEVVRAVRPYGVDVASGVEREPARKDWIAMRRFVENAKAA